jgi:hypothetical protein
MLRVSAWHDTHHPVLTLTLLMDTKNVHLSSSFFTKIYPVSTQYPTNLSNLNLDVPKDRPGTQVLKKMLPNNLHPNTLTNFNIYVYVYTPLHWPKIWEGNTVAIMYYKHGMVTYHYWRTMNICKILLAMYGKWILLQEWSDTLSLICHFQFSRDMLVITTGYSNTKLFHVLWARHNNVSWLTHDLWFS